MKKFIIVHDGKKDSSKMADQLNAMISQLEVVTTTPWSEKQYLNNKPTLSSEEYLVFLGKTKTGQNISDAPSFKNYYSEFNMHYGWLGKQAVIGLEPKFGFDEENIKKFSDLYNATIIENNAKEKKTKGKLSEVVSKVGEKNSRPTYSWKNCSWCWRCTAYPCCSSCDSGNLSQKR